MALFGSLAHWIQQSLTWQSRANQAWGPSRVWGSGSSFETLGATDAANYATWLAAAHSDLNVYTNRYNQGVADGTAAGIAAETPASLNVLSVGTGGSLNGQLASFTANRTGQWMIAFRNASNAGGGGWIDYTLLVNGGPVTSPINMQNIPTAASSSVTSFAGGFVQMHLNTGDVIALAASQQGGATASNGGGTLAAAFIPTPAELR